MGHGCYHLQCVIEGEHLFHTEYPWQANKMFEIKKIWDMRVLGENQTSMTRIKDADGDLALDFSQAIQERETIIANGGFRPVILRF